MPPLLPLLVPPLPLLLPLSLLCCSCHHTSRQSCRATGDCCLACHSSCPAGWRAPGSPHASSSSTCEQNFCPLLEVLRHAAPATHIVAPAVCMRGVAAAHAAHACSRRCAVHMPCAWACSAPASAQRGCQCMPPNTPSYVWSQRYHCTRHMTSKVPLLTSPLQKPLPARGRILRWSQRSYFTHAHIQKSPSHLACAGAPPARVHQV